MTQHTLLYRVNKLERQETKRSQKFLAKANMAHFHNCKNLHLEGTFVSLIQIVQAE